MCSLALGCSYIAARDTQVALALLAGMVNGGYMRRARAGDADELPSKAILTEL